MSSYIVGSADGGETFAYIHEVGETQLDLLAGFSADRISSGQSGSLSYSTTGPVDWKRSDSQWDPIAKPAIRRLTGSPGAVTGSFGVLLMHENPNTESLRPRIYAVPSAVATYGAGESWQKFEFATPAISPG
ncbi:hypothetical protein ACFWUP_05035 [Nocardia sp. NPDC058658]|uniref:hypothetical protein n=1 Tax=Nocardia sp. NPDC058658 TaxID=3346580 RepID=UPI0036604CB7